MRTSLLGLLILIVVQPGSVALPMADRVKADEFDPDELLLKEARVGTQAEDLVAFLRKQVLADKERERIEALVRQLVEEQPRARDTAIDQLVVIGAPAASFLRQASRSTNPNVAQRAGQALTRIADLPDSTMQSAAVRLLARKPTAEALAVLLEFFPFAGDDWLEHNVLIALGTVGTRDGKVDALLEKSLGDPVAARRGATGAVLGRWAGPEQRAAVRKLLTDPDARVRALTAHGLLGEVLGRPDTPVTAEERKALKDAGVADDAAGLLTFFRQGTLNPEARKRVERSVQNLDSRVFAEREEATKHLIATGRPALGYLRPALKGANLDLTRRLEYCITEIEKEAANMLRIVAARCLAQHRPAEAVKVLLDYVPFADNAMIEEEVIACLARLAVQEVEVPAALVAGLKDELPGSRAAAAVVLGHVGTKDHCDRIKPLLGDASTAVRLRAAEGLLAAKDRDALPVLAALVGDGPAAQAGRAEELLRVLAGVDAPKANISSGRAKAHEAWVAWHRDRGATVDLTAHLREGQFGPLLVIESVKPKNIQRLVAYSRGGKGRWIIGDDVKTVDAHWLPGNRVLIAYANKVVERDMATGRAVWEWKHNGAFGIICCHRLPNGNTFVATNGSFHELTPNGKVLHFYPLKTPNSMVMYCALRLRSGMIACIDGDLMLHEFDHAGKHLRGTRLSNGAFFGLEELPGGHLLASNFYGGDGGRDGITELDTARKQVGQWKLPGACHTIRLPNGNLLATGEKSIVELDRQGRVVSEQMTEGRPSRVRWR